MGFVTHVTSRHRGSIDVASSRMVSLTVQVNVPESGYASAPVINSIQSRKRWPVEGLILFPPIDREEAVILAIRYAILPQMKS